MNFLRKPLLPNRGISELSYPRSNLSLGATELYALGMAPPLNNTHIKVAHCKTAISTVPKADPPSDSRSKSHPKQRTAAAQCWQQSFVWLPHCLFLPPHTAETAGPCPTSSTEDIGHEVYLSTETHQQPMCTCVRSPYLRMQARTHGAHSDIVGPSCMRSANRLQHLCMQLRASQCS